MTKNALHVILCAVLWDVASCASRPKRGGKQLFCVISLDGLATLRDRRALEK
jgi:hypothetical protein